MTEDEEWRIVDSTSYYTEWKNDRLSIILRVDTATNEAYLMPGGHEALIVLGDISIFIGELAIVARFARNLQGNIRH